MKSALVFAALLEVATGLALIVNPPLVTRLLLGESVSGAGLALGRVAGIALLALGVACWPNPHSTSWLLPACRAMLTYNSLTAVFLIYVRIGGEFVGPLLWPAAALHGVLAMLFVGACYRDRAASEKRSHIVKNV